MRHLCRTLVFFLALLFVVAGFAPTKALAQAETSLGQPQFHRGTVTAIDQTQTAEIGGYSQTDQAIQVRLSTGETVSATYVLPQGTSDERLLEIGTQVVLASQDFGSGTPEYVVTDLYRLPSLIFIFIVFIAVIVVFAGIKGATALAGLGVSIAMLLYWVVPQIAAGVNPFMVGLVGAIAIGGISIFLAHGFNRRTTLAAISMFITLGLAIVLAVSFVSLTNIFGLGSEAALELQYGVVKQINLQGLLLAGIIIGALGVLDDITTAQAAAIEELHKANPKLSFNEIYRRGMSVGREHITSLVNTLALAYAGASLPVLLLFTVYQQPLWVTLNGEFVAEEIVRTIIGSLALTLAVPITTFLAAAYFTGQLRLATSTKKK